ncbi:MAG TPA: carotenoid oxygenase family protein [Solirubrobacteraceae bacterium]
MLLEHAAGRRLGTTSLERETVLDGVPVEGSLPRWLNGTLLRNGPGAFEAGGTAVRHWFDGFAMLHRFTIADGRVSYANRFLQTRALRAARAGRIGYREFATDPCRSLFRRLTTLFVEQDMSDNAVVNIARAGDDFIAMSETPLPVVFEPRTLETLGIDGHPPGQLPTAHPHADRSGDLLNVAVHLGPVSSYRVYRRGAGGRHTRLARVPVRHPAYLHSFALTERFVILALSPLTVDPLRLALADRPFIENYRWTPERGTELLAIERASGRVAQRWRGEPCFLFHHINAFEDGDDLVVDLCAYHDPQLIEDLFLDRLRSGADVAQARPRRYRLALGGGRADHELLADVELELPRIDDRLDGRPYRIAWGISRRDPHGFADALIRLDVQTREHVRWSEPDCFPGEPVFVARPGGRGEDDGVVLSLVLDAGSGRSFLLVLDAATLDELARAALPHHVPFGIHGQFYGDLADA